MHPGIAWTRRTLQRVLFRLLLAFVVVAPAYAEELASCPPSLPSAAPSSDEIRRGIAQARDRGYLWRISKDDHASYLYGTIHVAKREWAIPGPSIVRALREVDKIALELDPSDPQVKAAMATGMTMAPAAQPELPAALKERIARRIRVECLPPEALRNLKPQAQVTVLTLVSGRREGLEFAYGIDGVLAGFARAANKPVVSLETVDQQLKASQAAMGLGTVAALEQAMDELESGRTLAHMVRLADLWAASDLEHLPQVLAELEGSGTEAARALAAEVVVDRNRGMAEGIDALHMAGSKVFAAVGSLHMVGAVGLPSLMAEKGYKVERIAPP